MLAESVLSVTGLAASVGIGLIFLTAGIEKRRHHVLLPGVIANYRLLPEALVAPVATVLPWAEIALGAALIAGLTPLPVLTGIALLGLFAGAMAINVARGRTRISCGCGRPELQHGLSWGLVARNLALAALLASRLVPAGPASLMDMATGAAAGIGAYLAYVLLHAIGALAAAPALARAPASRR